METNPENATVENSLIERAQNGSIEAFEEIVRRHQRAVRAFIVRHVNDRQAADDIAQDVFVAAFRGIDRYLGIGSIGAWLIGIARNHVLTYLRNKPKSASIPLETVLDEVHLTALEQEPSDLAAELLRVDALRSCIQLLEASKRDVLIRFYYHSESADQIGRTIGKPAGAVRMMLLRIRKLLRNCIETKIHDGRLLG